MRVPIKRVDASLPLPEYASEGATGFDFVCRLDVTVAPGAIAYLPSNCIIKVPDGFVLVVALRSSTPARKGLLCPNGVGIIDTDYCGPDDEIKLQVYNFTTAPVVVNRGERIAQGLLLPVVRAQWSELDMPTKKSRGGFGSTG